MMGDWFVENVMRKVGNGVNTSFWIDTWLGDVTFRDRFRRLFDLSENQWMYVA